MFFSLLPAIFFELPITGTPDNSNLFRFPLKVVDCMIDEELRGSHYAITKIICSLLIALLNCNWKKVHINIEEWLAL